MPKCLMEPESGVTILDFILNRVEDVNPSRIFIVTRPRFRGVLKKRLKERADLVETDKEEFGNLYSVSLALKKPDANSFLILMSDKNCLIADVLRGPRHVTGVS